MYACGKGTDFGGSGSAMHGGLLEGHAHISSRNAMPQIQALNVPTRVLHDCPSPIDISLRPEKLQFIRGAPPRFSHHLAALGTLLAFYSRTCLSLRQINALTC